MTEVFQNSVFNSFTIEVRNEGASNPPLTEGSTQLEISTNSGITSVGSDFKN